MNDKAMKKLVDLDENAEVIAVFGDAHLIHCTVKDLHTYRLKDFDYEENRLYFQCPGVYSIEPTGIMWPPEFFLEKLLDYCEDSWDVGCKDNNMSNAFLKEVSDLLYKKTLESGNFFAKEALEPHCLDISGFKFKD